MDAVPHGGTSGTHCASPTPATAAVEEAVLLRRDARLLCHGRRCRRLPRAPRAAWVRPLHAGHGPCFSAYSWQLYSGASLSRVTPPLRSRPRRGPAMEFEEDLPWTGDVGGLPVGAPSPPPDAAPELPASALQPSRSWSPAARSSDGAGPSSSAGHGRRRAAAAAAAAAAPGAAPPGEDPEEAHAASWAGAAGWAVYFPKDEDEASDECDGRRRAVRTMAKWFADTPAGRALLAAEPHLTWVLPLDMRRLDRSHPEYVADAALSILRNAAWAIEAAPDATLGMIGLAAKRAAYALATAPPEPPPSDHGTGSGRSLAEVADFHTGPVTLSARIWPRVRHFAPVTPLRALKGGSVGKFVAVRGTVIRASATRQQVRSMQFECGKCGSAVAANFHDFLYEPPTRCARSPRCRARAFVPLRATAESVDWQKIRLQEILDEDAPRAGGGGGGGPRRRPRRRPHAPHRRRGVGRRLD